MFEPKYDRQETHPPDPRVNPNGRCTDRRQQVPEFKADAVPLWPLEIAEGTLSPFVLPAAVPPDDGDDDESFDPDAVPEEAWEVFCCEGEEETCPAPDDFNAESVDEDP